MFDTLSIKPTVLVIEDEKTQRHLLINKLEKHGFNVLTEENGKDGIETWSNNMMKVRIVITDLEMPGADGFQVIKSIREHEKVYTYIMVLTSREDQESLIKGLRYGADDFVSKPIATAELAVRLQGARRRLRLHDQNCLVSGLAELAAERGGESRTHLQRTKQYCTILASDLLKDRDDQEITAQLVEDIANICVLHDIGKSGIPDALLMKRGRYTPKEYEIMKDHTVIGGKILMDLYQQTGSLYLLLGHEIALSHHEKWDGTGYPNGLKGDAIPLAARIMCFVDVYDSLLSRRPYKDPMPLSFVEEHIHEQNRKKFDPDVIASYERNKQRFLDIQKAIKDVENPW